MRIYTRFNDLDDDILPHTMGGHTRGTRQGPTEQKSSLVIVSTDRASRSYRVAVLSELTYGCSLSFQQLPVLLSTFLLFIIIICWHLDNYNGFSYDRLYWLIWITILLLLLAVFVLLKIDVFIILSRHPERNKGD